MGYSRYIATKFRADSRGAFTLIEVILVLAILMPVFMTMHLVFDSNWISYNRELIAIAQQSVVRSAIEKIVEDIRESDDLEVHSIKPSYIKLTLKNSDEVIYKINASGKLTKKVNGGTEKTLCEDVDADNSVFKWAGARSVDIEIKLVKDEGIYARRGPMPVEMELFSSAQRRNL